MKIDPFLILAVRAVQHDFEAAQRAYEQFFKELFRRYKLHPAKNYHFADDGTVTEVKQTKAAGNGSD